MCIIQNGVILLLAHYKNHSDFKNKHQRKHRKQLGRDIELVSEAGWPGVSLSLPLFVLRPIPHCHCF